MRRNKKDRTFKYHTEEPRVWYRALDKNGNLFCESDNLEDVLEEASRLDKVTFERMEVFEATDGYLPYKPAKLETLRNPKPTPTGMPYGRGHARMHRGYRRP